MKRHILNTLLLLIALLLLPGWAWADVSWNFTSTPSADKTALKAVCEFLLPSIPQKSIIFKINIHLSFDFVVY
jgi:hypothetical protein